MNIRQPDTLKPGDLVGVEGFAFQFRVAVANKGNPYVLVEYPLKKRKVGGNPVYLHVERAKVTKVEERRP